MKYIAVLLTVFNRRDKTIECLDNLFKQKLPSDYTLEVFLTNDGCTDGTPETVHSNFPNVHIIDGDGSLFWNRGMYTAWKKAANTRPYDYYLWLNDDTFIYDGAIEYMLDSLNKLGGDCILAGATCSPNDSSFTTYSGFVDKKMLQVDGTFQRVKKFNGNFVLIPRSVFKKLGFNDPYYRHSFGDIDYGLRANKIGIPCYITSKHIGTCAAHEKQIACFDRHLPLKKRLKAFYSPLGMNPFEFFHMNLKTEGLIKAVLVFFSTHIRVVFPILWEKH